MAEKKKGKGNAVVWTLLGLLILSLGGFGIGGFGGTIRTVAEVGDQEVLTGDYARALEAEQRRASQLTGQPLSLDQLKLLGLDRQVMDRLLAGAALAHETGEMDLSVGDAEVAQRIRANPGFGGLAGGFDREGYAYALRNAGLTERAFEARTRTDAAQEILQAAIIGGADAPPGYAETIAAWIGERRDATIAEVTSAQLDAGAVAPTEEQLEAFRTENAALFQTPERRRVTYGWASPDAIAPTLEVDEADIEAAYEARAAEYRLPRRVLAERLVFADAEAAEAARARIEAEETTFDALVEARGLDLADVDQGELAAADLDEALAEALFALEEPGLAGPVETSLGPAIFRVNAILDERVTPLEDVRDVLTREAALAAAREVVRDEREAMDDALVGGATLEEVAGETVMEVGTLAYDPSVSEGLAGYEAFRRAVLRLDEDDFPELIELADGGLFAMRLDGIDAPTLPPLDDIRAEVEAAWQSDSLRTRLAERAEALAARIAAGESFEDVGLAADAVTDLARDGQMPGGPRDVVDAIFEADAGAVVGAPGDEARAFVLRVDAVHDADPEAEGNAAVLSQLRAQTRAEVAQDVFQAFGAAAQEAAGATVNPQAVTAVETQIVGGGHGGM